MGVEEDLFEWKEWDLVETGVFQFYECKLKVPVDKYPAGSQIPIVVVNFDAKKLELYDGSKVLGEANIRLSLTNA